MRNRDRERVRDRVGEDSVFVDVSRSRLSDTLTFLPSWLETFYAVLFVLAIIALMVIAEGDVSREVERADRVIYVGE